MFSRRKRWGKLQQKYSKFSRVTENRHRTKKTFEHCFPQMRCRFHIPSRIRFCAALQIRRQQLCRCGVKRKQLVQLYIERELIRSCCAPPFHHSRFRHGIKRRIYLDQIEVLCVPTEAFASRHLLRIPTLDKPGIRPARRADQNFSAHTSTKSP